MEYVMSGTPDII